MFILDAVTDICLVTLSLDDELRRSRHLERSMSQCRTWSGVAFSCSEAFVVLNIFMQYTSPHVPGLRACRGDNSYLPEVWGSPHVPFPSSLSWEINTALSRAIFQGIHILSLFKKTKTKTTQPGPSRGACLSKTSLKALSVSFLSFSCQNGCNLDSATVKFISCLWCWPDLLYHTYMPVKW